MKFKYKVDLCKSYLIAELSDMQSTSNYQLKMITKNKIPGLLSCVESYGNEIRTLQYDISGKKSLQHEFLDKEIQFDEILNILQEICFTLAQIKIYLLDEKYLILDPEYIFYDWESGKFKFLFFPEIHDNNEKLKQLADFFIEHANHKDEKVVNISYSFYKMSKEPFFSLESFLESMVSNKNTHDRLECQNNEIVDIQVDETNIQDDNLFGLEKDDNKIEIDREEVNIRKNGSKISIYLSIIFLISCIGIGVLVRYLEITYQQKIVLLSMSGLCLFISIGLVFHGIYLKKKGIYKKSSMESKAQQDDFEVESIGSSNDETVYFGKNGSMEECNILTLQWEENGISKQVPLHNLPLILGKSLEHSQIVINHISISRQHCKFIDNLGRLSIADIGSTNGTSLNGILLNSNEYVTIERGDEIEIGKILCKII